MEPRLRDLRAAIGRPEPVRKPWRRISERASDVANTGISDCVVRIGLQAAYAYRAHVFSARLGFPLFGDSHGCVKGIAGDAASLRNHNFRNAGIGIGVSLIEWL